MFNGFSKEALSLLRRLPSFDKGRFEEHRKAYAKEIQQPVKDFVNALGPYLQEHVSQGVLFSAKTHGSIGPINNDVRFNPKAATYKDHILLRFWEGPSKKTAPTLFVRLASNEVGFAVGMMFDDLGGWREVVDRKGAELSALLSTLEESTGGQVVGQDLKRVPAPYSAEHAQSDLLRHKWLQVRWPRPMPAVAASKDLVTFCGEQLALAGDTHRWWVENLT